MATDFELTLLGGRMRLVDSGSTRSLLQEPAPSEYEFAQAAVERAFAVIAEATGRMNGDNVDEAALRHALRQGAVRLVLRGHQRELHVAALHLHVRYELDFDAMVSGTAPGVHLAPIPDAGDGYGTYRFESDMRPLEAMRGLLARWMSEAEREPQANGKAQRNHARWKQLLALGSSDGAPVRVVVTGVTGAGKSTFLNGLLGRDLVPCSSGVCTAAVLRLRSASYPDGEGARVHWRPLNEIRTLAAKLLAEAEHLGKKQTTLLTAATSDVLTVRDNVERSRRRMEYCKQKVVALRQAERACATGATSWIRLSDLPDYARNDPDSCAEATQEIEVFIFHPLLEHVEIVDAPGLRDGDDQRQKMLARAFQGDTAWLYLVPADARNESCRDDWKHIKELANNDSGVLVLTKADGQPSNPGDSIDRTMQQRMYLDYVSTFGWHRPMTWCSALLPSRLASLRGKWTEAELESAFTESKLPVILDLPSRAAKTRLENFLHDESRDPLRRRVFTDYALDASRLPCVMRKVGRVLYEDAITKKVSLGRDELTVAAKEAIAICSTAIAETDRVLKAHDAVAAQQQEARDAEKRIAALQEELDRAGKRHDETLGAIGSECGDAASEFQTSIRDRTANLKRMFDDEFDAQSESIWMSGDRSFSLVKHLESPLSEVAHESLKQLAESVLKRLAPFSKRGLSSREIRPEQCVIASTGVPDVDDQEAFFEWKDTTRARMWKVTNERARWCSTKLMENFAEEARKILRYARDLLQEDRAKREAAIAAEKDRLRSLTRAIRENNPAQSRMAARERLAAYTEHKSVFETFLRDLPDT